MKKRVFIFDLDGTVIDSEHRTPRDENGKLILQQWFDLATPANIAKDTLLPLASLFRKAKRKHHHIVICTARTLSKADREFLSRHALGASYILSRPEGDMTPDGEFKKRLLQDLFKVRFHGLKKIMFDDNDEVRETVSKIGVKMVDPRPLNEVS
jgi:FMN phosphatase YigB (HAD superfamily)|tara:strand:- start:1615 stop:2076 length:462 start_codon:yes stop_codon:yes gene_type:complete